MGITVEEHVRRLKKEIDRVQQLPNPGVKEIAHQARLRDLLTPLHEALANSERIMEEHGPDKEV